MMDSFVAPGTIFHQHQPVIEGNIYKLGHNISSLQGSGSDEKYRRWAVHSFDPYMHATMLHALVKDLTCLPVVLVISMIHI
jgi:hypothetical protein